MNENMKNLQKWVGRTEERNDTITETPIQGMEALLDKVESPHHKTKELPLASHWLYFLPKYRQSEIGLDGHKLLGEFLPPVALPRRMWAGGRLNFLNPLYIGDHLKKISRIKKIKHVTGKTGDLVFVIVNHEIIKDNQILIEEDHDIVYRSAPKVGDPVPKIKSPPGNADWSRIVNPDPVFLFRYSALTFNSHKIHYDRKYVMEEEGYPGLVVHGPLLATLLLDLVNSEVPSRKVKIFDYRAVRPVFDTSIFSINGKLNGDNGATLWTTNNDGSLAMIADVEFLI